MSSYQTTSKPIIWLEPHAVIPWMKMMTMSCQGAVQVTVIHSLEKEFKSSGKTTSTAS